jgi:Winged helix DNA-binding domain
MTEWSFLTNHARVLVCIAHDPGVRLRDIATKLGITERSAYAIVTDLTAAGYVVKEKDTDGRRNRYQIQSHLPLPETIGRERTVGEVLDVLVDGSRRPGRRASRPTPQGRRSHHEPVPRSGRADYMPARSCTGQNRAV